MFENRARTLLDFFLSRKLYLIFKYQKLSVVAKLGALIFLLRNGNLPLLSKSGGYLRFFEIKEN
jgi:hypothetical protein